MAEGKINLQYPYKADFKAGYCYKNSEPRRVVGLIDFNGSRTSTSYARYLMSCHLERYLKEDEHVDHINDDKLDDRIENLQILSPEENARKSATRSMVEMICPVCGNKFTKEYRQTNMGKGLDRNYQACSRSCGGKASHINPNKLERRFKIVRKFRE